MSSIKSTEWEVASQIKSWIRDRIISNNYPFTDATVETGVKSAGSLKRGDIVIWSNLENRTAYSYIEIKPPFGASENLETFRQKAIAFGVKYAFTFDFQTLNVYKIDNGKLLSYDSRQANLLNTLEEWKDGGKQASIKSFLFILLNQIEELNKTGKFIQFSPDKTFFINLIREIKGKLLPGFERFIKEQRRKPGNRELIDRYVVEQGISMPNDEAYFKIIANQRVYGLITKIIFYLTVRRFFTDLPDLSDTDERDLNRAIKIAFTKAAEKDWQAVFLEDPIEALGIPEDSEIHLRKFFEELKVYQFSNLKEDVIGELFEEIIDPEDRHTLGQYFTREDLVDFVIATVVNDKDGIYSDPTCGSGTFLIRLYDRLRFLRPQKTHGELLSQIWGIDIGKFPAELSTINLFRQNPQNFENFPRVLNKNIFDINKGHISEFPPPQAGKTYTRLKTPLPEFNAFVGNFPYIRQELIEKKSKGFKEELTILLAREYLLSYAKLFELHDEENQVELYKNEDESGRDKLLKKWVSKKYLQLKLSGQADIYAYIFIHTATLLATKGSFAIITSNSWLDVAYGNVLKEFFLDHFRIRMIIASWAEPWFEDAAVNTIITVLEKKDSDSDSQDNVVKFVKLKKNFASLIPFQDLILDRIKRWERIDAIVSEIESAQFKTKKCKAINQELSSYETDEMRIRYISQATLSKAMQQQNETNKWGKYLRAPDVYFELIEECKGRFLPLKDIAEVKRGYTTSINDFFYLENVGKNSEGESIYRNNRGWEGPIEETYLKKVIKSPKEGESIIINPDRLKYHIFICGLEKKELKKRGDKIALHYIEWGEKQKTEKGVVFPEVQSVKSRHNWYDLGVRKFPEIIIPCGIGDSFKVFDNSIEILTDKRLYEVYPKDQSEALLCLMNSTLFALFEESESRVSLGDGLLDLTVYEVESINTINPNTIPDKMVKRMKVPFAKIAGRKIHPISVEVKQKDRKELDSVILEILGLDPKEWLPKIYDGLCEMVNERLELPKMRKKQKKEREKFSYDEVKRSVIRDILNANRRKFPDRFYDGGVDFARLKFETYSIASRNLKIEYFLGTYLVKDDEGSEVFRTSSEPKAKFACIAAINTNGYSVNVPEDEKVCWNIISSYLEYASSLKKMLESNANMKLHDWVIAEKMAKEIMDEKEIILKFT